MQVEYLLIIAGLVAYTATVWGLGWYYGARAFRDRNRRFLALMKKFNANKNPQSQWYQGYTTGVATVLDSLERWLGELRVEDEDESP